MHTLSIEEVAEIVEMNEAAMWRAFWDAPPRDFAAQYGIHRRDAGSATAIFLEQLPNIPLLNRVIGLGISQPATEAAIDELVAFYTSIAAPCCISLSPHAKPAELMEWLAARGFQRSGSKAKFIRGIEPPPTIETDLQIERVEDMRTAQHLGAIVQVGFELPEWTAAWFAHCLDHPHVNGYVAYADDVPVGAGLLIVNGEWGSLGAGVTLPAYRRRGAQGAIMARRIRDGIAMGCRWLTTETNEDTPEQPNPSYRNMVRTGFQLAYLRSDYIAQPQAAENRLTR